MSVAKNNKQLRAMFEAKKLAQSTSAQKVEHILATVSPAGDLICKLCRVKMKNAPAFWEKHLATPEHKMALLKATQPKSVVAAAPVVAAPVAAVASQSSDGWAELQAEFADLRGMSLAEFRALTQAEVDEFITQVPLAKKGKLRLMYKPSSSSSSLTSSSSSTSSSTPAASSSSSSSRSSTPAQASSLPSDFFDSPPSNIPTGLPSDFFDSAPLAASTTSQPAAPPPTTPSVASTAPQRISSADPSDFADPDDEESSSEEEAGQPPEQQVAETPSSDLPVGFFDDKKVDKTMHKQRDFTKEVKEFRDLMVEAATISRQQQLADHKQLAVLRQHAEEEDAKALHSRLEELKKQTAAKKELLASKKRKTQANEDSDDDDGSDVDLFDTEGLFGWRSKNALDK